jgi:hypothetical protein
MPLPSDLSKITDKLGLQKIVNDIKSLVSPATIPITGKDDPITNYLSEINKLGKELADNNAIQLGIVAKINSAINGLYQQINLNQTAANTTTANTSAEPTSQVDTNSVLKAAPTNEEVDNSNDG